METYHLKGGATIDFEESFLLQQDADALFQELQQLNYEQPTISMWGKDVLIPRLQSWMASSQIDQSKVALYQKQPPADWSKSVAQLRDRIQELYGETFDYVLINYYPNGKYYINYHTDGEHDDNSVIASVSLGDTRRFLLRNIDEKSMIKEFRLTHGSLIVMRDQTQTTWQHSIPKTAKVVGPRINLTFRKIKL